MVHVDNVDRHMRILSCSQSLCSILVFSVSVPQTPDIDAHLPFENFPKTGGSSRLYRLPS